MKGYANSVMRGVVSALLVYPPLPGVPLLARGGYTDYLEK